MKSVFVLLGLCMASVAVHAQGCCIASTCCGVLVGCNSCDGTPSFSTVHKWKPAGPGTLELGGTSFRIVFDDADFNYHLKWKARELAASSELAEVERKGVTRASDRQDAGLPLE